jgi:hypothetical protein
MVLATELATGILLTVGKVVALPPPQAAKLEAEST